MTRPLSPTRRIAGFDRIRQAAFIPAILCLTLAAAPIHAADPEDAEAKEDRQHKNAVTEWVAANRRAIAGELAEWLAIPNVSSDYESMRANAGYLKKMLEKRGLEVRLLETATAPYVYARLRPEGKPASEKPPVVLFYCHFDGQPVDPSRWTVTPPFSPRLTGPVEDPETRIYARSASDDKSPIVGLMAGIDALRAAGIPPNIDAKFIFDPEEEIGSPQINQVLSAHKDLLEADLMIFADGPVHQAGGPTVVFGTRGIVTVSLTLYGPAVPLHSGHYGNWAPNPAEKLAELLASMKNSEGEVLVKGFYDDVEPFSETELKALAAIPEIDGNLKQDLLFPTPDGAGRTLQELINRPSLNVRGMASGWVGEDVRTIVPDKAVAEIDLRLVREIQPQDQVERIKAHIRSQGYHVVEEEPDAATRRAHRNVVKVTHGPGVPAARSSMDTPLSRSLILAVSRASKTEPILMPSLGGTGPLHPFVDILGMPVYAVPIVNPDNNQHSPDENLRLGNFWDGIVIYASLLRFPPPIEDVETRR